MNKQSIYIKSLLFLVFMLLINVTSAFSGEITNIRHYRISDNEVIIYYDLISDSPSPVSLRVSLDGGETFSLIPAALSGDVGNNVLPGNQKRIVWKITQDIENPPEEIIIQVISEYISIISPSLPETSGTSTISAVRAGSPVNLDGLLNEPQWKEIIPVSDFTQRELQEGAAATEKTEVRIMYDENNIYFGVICFDSEPDKIIHKQLQWDGGGSSGGSSGNRGPFTPVDDMFTLVIDTYNDRRTGLYFAVNPNGAQYDGSFENGDFRINLNWNGIWEVRSQLTDYGWSCEIAIPFKTLRFPTTETQEWAVNFMRNIRRKNEEVLWRAWARNEGINRLLKAGTVIIDESLNKGYKLDVTPYVLTGVENVVDEETNIREKDTVLKSGADIKYGITSNTTIDLTTRTDFAQIEDDREVINLTRFDISYPEKRDFFLEGAETFKFSLGMREELFYSRKIGITEDHDQLPILGGAKITQKSGSYRLGLMTMQTESKYGIPSTNYSVVRVKKDVLKQSYIGFIGTSLYDMDKHDNKLFGVDFSYNSDSMFGDKNIEITGALAGTVTDGKKENSLVKRLSVVAPNDVVFVYLTYCDIGEDFNPEMGFLRRTGVKNYYSMFRFTPRSNLPLIRKFAFEPLYINYYTDHSGKLLSRDLRIQPFGIDFNSADRFEFVINNNFEYLDEEFEIFDDNTIPVGSYDWWFYSIQYNSSQSKPVAFNVKSEWGDFYNGKRDIVEVECILKTNMYYSLSADVKYNNITLSNERFETKEYGSRIVFDLSTRLSSSTFLQWNNETHEMNVNFRIHYMPKVGSDIFLVYNRLMDEQDDFNPLYNTAMFKIDYTFRF
ncbi:DUF5916 domain-containing protein [Candidatus Latescibacterota bacterium]